MAQDDFGRPRPTRHSLVGFVDAEGPEVGRSDADPSGEHLVSLARHSEAVLIVLLVLADRVVPEDGKD